MVAGPPPHIEQREDPAKGTTPSKEFGDPDGSCVCQALLTGLEETALRCREWRGVDFPCRQAGFNEIASRFAAGTHPLSLVLAPSAAGLCLPTGPKEHHQPPPPSIHL
ncbi:Hypothetical predicted protein [Podarcis lilfordi]|nr:Hypothetical predicted protein [Podarcis lilfordi]